VCADLGLTGDVAARLAALRRGSGEPGALAAAEIVCRALAETGLPAAIELEPVHGTYWWPVGLAVAAGAVGGLTGRRLLAAAGAIAAWDDLDLGPRLVRRALPRRTAANVVAHAGPADAPRTLVVHAHHDAAHTGLAFHPAFPRAVTRLAGGLVERAGATPVPLQAAVLGPALGAVGGRRLRRLGGLVSAVVALAVADIARSPVVPGANDNLSGVLVLLALARRLAVRPPRRLRVLLLSTGAEESFLEGMVRFGARWFGRLDRATTSFLCLESVGSPELMLLDGEGLVRLHRYPPEPSGLLRAQAERLGIELHRPFRYRLATDGQVPARSGYATAVLTSIDPRLKAPSHYHWPSDRLEHLDSGTLRDALRLAAALVDRLDRAA
jgi:Peptidase family M28